MNGWTNKQWGALIGGLLIFLISLLGIGTAALILLFSIAGYYVGKFLDGELDLQEVREQAQERVRR